MDVFFSLAFLNNFRELSPAVKNHLTRVYLTLCCVLLASALGAYLHMLWNIGGFVSTLGLIRCVTWVRSPRPYENPTKRLSLLFLCALLNGVSIGLIMEIAINRDLSILITAFVGLAVAFLCFSVAAMLTRRREYIYLVGLLSSGMSILMVLQSASSIFTGSASIFKLKLTLFFGLMIYVGYIVVKTQELIENAHGGDMDFVQHSYTFFTNLAVVFLRVLCPGVQICEKEIGGEEAETSQEHRALK